MKCSAGGLSFDIYNTHIGLAQKKLLRMKKTSRDFKEQGKAVLENQNLKCIFLFASIEHCTSNFVQKKGYLLVYRCDKLAWHEKRFIA